MVVMNLLSGRSEVTGEGNGLATPSVVPGESQGHREPGALPSTGSHRSDRLK